MELNIENIERFNVNEYLHRTFGCSCGRQHSVNIDRIVIENGALKKIPEVITEFGYKNPCFIADKNTYAAALQKAEEILVKANVNYSKHVLYREGDLVPDEAAVGELLLNIDKKTDVIVAVGTGVLNDLCKYMSYRTGIPYIIVATAPSMDGFASDGAALIIDNLKTTLQTTMPKAIIGDVDVLKEAPEQMIMAGFGDMIGKFSALNDWKLSNIINNEYYCENIVKIVKTSVNKCINCAEGLTDRNDQAIKSLMEGLVITGIAMSFAGNSRPASGSEHHLAHFWEMMFLFEAKQPVLHGIKVGINTLAANIIREQLTDEKPDFERILKNANEFDNEKWLNDINNIYRKAAPGIINLNKKEKINSLDERLDRLGKIQENWELIKNTLKEVPTTNEIEKLLKMVEAPLRAVEVGVDENTVEQGMIYAKEVRARYTILQLLWDLNLLNNYAKVVSEFIYN